MTINRQLSAGQETYTTSYKSINEPLLTYSTTYDNIINDTEMRFREGADNDGMSDVMSENPTAPLPKQSADDELNNGDVTMARAKKYPLLIGLISSKNPVPALVLTVQSLFEGGAARVVVVDDGSDDPESIAIFDQAEAVGAKVIHLKKNVGKSKALKRGFKTLPKNCIIVQTDDDTLAGRLSGPAQLIIEGKADIVDIRVETTKTHSLIGVLQEFNYWLVNAVTKRIQDIFRARLWMSGASVMYSYQAGKELILHEAETMTEDTEGLFRARTKGWKVRYYAKHDGQFLTMVPEDFSGLHKQWKRWSIGNGQVIGIYGMGGGNARISTINIISWFNLLVSPILVSLQFGAASTMLWASGWGIIMGFIGAIRLKRMRVMLVGMFLPYITAVWALHAFQGLLLAYWRARSGVKTSLTWVSPKRTTIDVDAMPLQS
jgi:cellulose synthase/poly-beta-1,6-N-acetylglucosamine synthase-like glycosyltransferase